jgi:3-oxoacyl-[acyl-carrier-protein] synthase II
VARVCALCGGAGSGGGARFPLEFHLNSRSRLAARPRIAVTGRGVITPLGAGPEENWRRIEAGEAADVALAPAQGGWSGPAARISVDAAALIPDLDKADKVDPFSLNALAAVPQAIEESGLAVEPIAEKAGVFVGTAFSGVFSVNSELGVLETKGPRKVHPLLVQKWTSNAPAGEIGLQYGFKGPNLAVVGGCPSGGVAVAQAAQALVGERGLVAMLVGGTDAPFVRNVGAYLAAFGMISPEEAQFGARPFDRSRRGFVPGEGAGLLVLETVEGARSRGAEVLAELVGWAMAFRSLDRTFDPEAGARAVRSALARAELEPGDVDVVFTSGNGSVAGDAGVLKVLGAVFGAEPEPPPITTVRGATGETLAAGTPVDVSMAVEAMRRGRVPGAAGLVSPDGPFAQDTIVTRTTERSIDAALVVSFGFEGLCVALVLRSVA